MTGNLSFKLQIGDVAIIDEVYTPSDGKIVIRCKEVIDEILKVKVPLSDNDIFEQNDAIKNFRAILGNREINFTVVKGGIGDLAESSEIFMKTQWLTLQPQQKRIIPNQPEWLTCFAVV
ncbi:MAG: hypothetical protein ACLUDU_21655, partial [Butyricimonas faecihominis]